MGDGEEGGRWGGGGGGSGQRLLSAGIHLFSSNFQAANQLGLGPCSASRRARIQSFVRRCSAGDGKINGGQGD